MKNNPSIGRLEDLLTYEPEAGVFYWNESRGCVKRGDLAGSKSGHGYLIINIDGFSYQAHRLAWAIAYGEFPKLQIDHIDGVRDNNKISNLRQVSNAENLQNQRSARSDNKSGLIGAMYHKLRGKWRSQIAIGGKTVHLGLFDTAMEAHEAYVQAKRKLHPMGCL